MALNERRQDRPADARFYPCPTTVKAGDPVLIGKLAGVALDDYSVTLGGTVFRLAGSHDLSVSAVSVISPQSGADIKPGDKIWADGGTTDTTTNVTTGFTLDANSSSGVYFGNLDQSTKVSSTVTATATVKLKETGN